MGIWWRKLSPSLLESQTAQKPQIWNQRKNGSKRMAIDRLRSTQGVGRLGTLCKMERKWISENSKMDRGVGRIQGYRTLRSIPGARHSAMPIHRFLPTRHDAVSRNRQFEGPTACHTN